MELKILHTVEKARDSEGVVVVIDVLRACTTIPILFYRGAKEIIPVLSIKDTVRFEKENYVFVGEGEAGGKHNAFHHNNSPSEVLEEDFTDKSIVFRSNNATNAILNAKKADEILLASFVNMGAIVSYIKSKRPILVTLIALGRLGERGLEDDLCAKAIKLNLEGMKSDFRKIRKEIQICDCAILVKETLGKPEDVELALRLNSFPVVPKVYLEKDHLVIKPYFEI